MTFAFMFFAAAAANLLLDFVHELLHMLPMPDAVLAGFFFLAATLIRRLVLAGIFFFFLGVLTFMMLLLLIVANVEGLLYLVNYIRHN
ncbi:hypothetical protein MIMGU_mgv1a017227mg [Erythranthe guttata]|uniref:Uncharacterized protein n=1 Tax=Erythranthe guttata TaxID=4155 RepID=A0A022PTN9_ERYGU|nr:hypothetical protein MIMGU_mgv1a017227mg [Erythranthe guttata]